MNKKILIFFASSISFFSSANFIYAANNVEVPGGPCASDNSIATCAVHYFQWGIGIAAVVAAISFVVGAVTLMASADNTELASSGKDRMRGSILGILLLGASYIILNTINPNLINPTLNPLNNVELNPTAPAPGVYFYSDESCDTGAGMTTQSADKIGADIKGIKIVNDETNTFGYILHQVEGLEKGGGCGEPVTDKTDCQPTNSMNGAIDVFRINPDAGSGTDTPAVTFYGRPYGGAKGARAGFYPVTADKITDAKHTETPSSMKFDYTGVNVPDEYKDVECVDFGSCPGSIDIVGDDLVAIYSSGSGGGSTTGSYCETFTNSVANLNTDPFVAAGTNEMTTIHIIPIIQ